MCRTEKQQFLQHAQFHMPPYSQLVHDVNNRWLKKEGVAVREELADYSEASVEHKPLRSQFFFKYVLMKPVICVAVSHCS